MVSFTCYVAFDNKIRCILQLSCHYGKKLYSASDEVLQRNGEMFKEFYDGAKALVGNGLSAI